MKLTSAEIMDYRCPSCKVKARISNKKILVNHKNNCEFYKRIGQAYPRLVQRIENGLG